MDPAAGPAVAPAPGGAPAWGSNPFSTGNLAQSVGQIAPLATEYHGAQNGVAINQVSNTSQKNTGVLATFGHWLGGAATQTGHIAGAVAQWLGQQTVSMATAPIRYGESEGQGIIDNLSLAQVQAQNKMQSARMDSLKSMYKSGRINKQQYLTGLDGLMQDEQNTSSQESALLHRLPTDQHQAVQATIDTASTLVTILTAGFGKAYATGISAKGLEPLAAKTTADYLSSDAAGTFFGSVEQSVAKIAADPGVFGKLGTTAQKFIQFATAEVVAQGGEMTAAQTARAVAVNLAFKYPLYYQAMSSTGAQIYTELDQKKYGDAVRTVAFNAALLLSGGPIGYALNKLGTGATILKNAVFGQTSFWDEVSKATGNGDAAGIFNAVNKITDPAIKEDVIKQLSAVEATNLGAVGGDAKAAAWRVIKGMSSYEGISLNNFTHEELLNNMVNFAKAQRLVDGYAKDLGKAITVGRVDARALDTIATGLTQTDVEAAAADDALSKIPGAQPEAVDMSKAPDFLQPEGTKPEYGMAHRPTEGPPAHDLLAKVEGDDFAPKDIYDHPEYYTGGGSGEYKQASQESIQALKSIKGSPDAKVTLYRASPKNELNSGDWVTFSKTYANLSKDTGEEVHSFTAQAKDVKWAGDDLNEFGYFPSGSSEQLPQAAKAAPKFTIATQAQVDANPYLKKTLGMLPKDAGYQITTGGDVLDKTGRELTNGEIQDLVQAPYLTEFEKASREGDTATMQRIAREHPGDNRVSMGSIQGKEPALKPLTEKMTGEKLPPASAEEKAALVAKAREQAATGNVAMEGGPTLSPVERRLQAWESMKMQNPNQAWANNENFDRQIKALVSKYADDPSGLESAVRKINASFSVDGIPESVSRQLAKMGYIAIKPVDLEAPFKEGTGKISTAFAKASDNFFLKTVQPLPVLGFVGDTLTKFGLSPNAANARVYQMFNENITRNLTESGIIGTSVSEGAQQETDTLLKQLSNYARSPTVGKLTSKMPITDFRMLTIKDIEAATGKTASEALQIQQAIGRAYVQVPLALRGLGDRAVDYLYSGPQGALARRYFRLQGALRFSWNPFFEYMRVIPKTEILTESEGGGVLESIFTGRYGQLNEVRGVLREAGMFDEAGHLLSGNSLGAEAADTDVIYTARNISKHLLPMQERSISGLVLSQADRMGMTVEDYVKTYPQQARDTVQAIAQYSRNYNFLNSPMARTLNVAIFPFRFESKVAGFLAKGLARQPLMTQVAFIHGLMQAHAWLNSPQGIAWYSKNSTAIQLFDYITPLAEMNKVFESLLPGHDHSLGNFGELGGLPFGWIPQLTDAEGWTHFNQPGVDAATGQIIPRYVPATDRGQIAIAIQDFIGSLFSYPGSTAGLPSKASITRNMALGLTMGTKATDLKLTTPPMSALSQQQQTYAQAVQALSANQIQPGQTVAQQPGLIPSQTVPGLKVPQMDSSLLHPTLTPKQQGIKTTKKKKGQYIPALLPGQTQLGVI